MKRIYQAFKNFSMAFANAREAEVYLARSTDHADLERRVKYLQRKGIL